MLDAVLPTLPMPLPMSLKQRVIRAGVWVMGGHIGAQLLRLGGNLIMTRILVPEMFGVMAIAYVFMTGLAMFSDIGIVQNIVQSRRGDDPVFLRTAWTVQILRGALICAVALAIAVSLHFAADAGLLAVGTVYADPALPPVLSVVSLLALIAGFESNRLALLRRNLDLSRVIRIDVGSQAISLTVMILWAVVDRSIWALVAGSLASALTRTLLSHVALPGTADRWGWDRAAFSEIFGFGKWVFLSSLLGFLVINGDRLLLGGLVDAKALGIYSVAATLVGALEAVLTKLVGDVGLPALSEVARARPERLRAVFYRFHFLIGVTALFIVGMLLTCGPIIVRILYDDRYQAAGWMLGVVGVGLATMPTRVATQCFLARGESRVISILTIVRLPALYLLTPLAFYFFGLAGALWSIALSSLTWVPIMWFYQSRAGLLDFKREAAVWPALLLGLLAGQGAIWLDGRLFGTAPLGF
jgi:O-antigen/teichoic acid export membrane protein